MLRRAVLGVLCLVSLPAAAYAQAADLAPLRKLLNARVEKRQVAGGAILLIHRGKVILDEGFGYADLKTKRAFPKDAQVAIASISKPMLGTALFRLVRKGTLDIDRPIDAYLPAFGSLKLESGEAASRAPTVRELLRHTSGMRKIKTRGGAPWYQRWTYGKMLPEVVDRYREYPLQSDPGTKYSYSGIGTDVAARVAEVASGMPRNELLIAELAEPLGMDHTFYRETDRMRDAPPVRYARADDGSLKPRPKLPRVGKNGYSSSGGAVLSTTHDVAVWLTMIRHRGKHEGGVYLTEKELLPMLTRDRLSSKASGGLSVRRTGARPGHPIEVGHTGSTGTFCWIDFERDLIGVVLTQTKAVDYGSFRKDVRALINSLLPVE